MLIHFGVIPYLVFDGDYLPSKATTEIDRAKKREESKKKGLELYRLNKPSQAQLELQKAVDVNPEMARKVIEELKKIGVQYVVAPYEADAQLVYLERKGMIQGILSEDSDLLVFGAKRLLTKLDQYGECVEINRADFTACREISLVGWSDAEFRRMAILSGCDYLANINKMGLKSAYRYVRKYKTIEKILQMLAFDGQYFIPPGYLEKFHKAELTFLHQRVFCPSLNEVVMMTEFGSAEEPEDLSFIGGKVDQDVAIGVSKGDLDPMTKQPICIQSTARSSPKTPWSNTRKYSVDARSDAKPNKSIDTFFKSKRVPLGELDPNSFTPSPTQARLLQRAGSAAWSSSPATAGPPSFRSSLSMPSSSTHTPQSNHISRAPSVSRVPIPEIHPLKRRRLCLDPDEDLASKTAVSESSGHSRFFIANTPKPSPSIKNSKHNKKGKNTDITIWSDDSIEDAMAELADVPARRESVGGEDSQPDRADKQSKPRESIWTEIRDDPVTAEDSQSSTASRGTESSDVSSKTQSSTTSISSISSVAQALDKHVTVELKALAASCSYQPETDRMVSQRRSIEKSIDRRPPNITNQAFSKPQFNRQRSMTPLQRLGAGALSRSKSCSEIRNNEHSEGKTTKEKCSDIDVAQISHPKPWLPLLSSFGPDASVTKGSEDHIIPNSEDSGDDILSETGEKTKRTIDLGRFAFSG